MGDDSHPKLTMRDLRDQQDTSRRVGRPSGAALFVTTVWLVACAAMSILAMFIWVLSPRFWLADICGNFSAPLSVISILLACVAVLRRRWIVVCLLLISGAALSWKVFDAPRAAWVGQGQAGSGIVRVATFNARASNTRGEDLYELLVDLETDVVIVLEAPHELIQIVRNQAGIPGELPHWDAPEPGHWWNVIYLSRWPMSWIEPERGPDFKEYRESVAFRRSFVVHHPEQDFILTILPLESPRTQSRWETGNEELRLFERVVDREFRASGLPIVAGADLNAAPTSFRTRLLTETTGMRRAKPWWALAGTWPAALPGPARVAIDDVLVSSGVGVRAWRCIGTDAGSDHAPVVAEIELGTWEARTPDEWTTGARPPDRQGRPGRP